MKKLVIYHKSGYILNNERSTCSNGAIPNWDIANSRLYVDDLTKSGTSCYLYFDEAYVARDYILADKMISERNDFSTSLTSDTTGIIYQAEDDDGTTYYYAGSPTDNWVRFGGFYWRIIRINGDGSIRMIYNGNTTNQTGSDTQIGTSAFNGSGDNAYVGFKYQIGILHGIESDSSIKSVLDGWYQNIINYSEYIDENAGFCGDRSLYSGSGVGTDTTYYAAHNRLSIEKQPSFKCEHRNDLYTVAGANKGNGALTYPVGLITADEVNYAGAIYGNLAGNFYLYTGQNYWTMTPGSYYQYNGTVYIVYSSSNLDGYVLSGQYGVRPVINLRSDLQFSGSGTTTDPYIVVGAD